MMSQNVFQNTNISSHKYSQPVKFTAQKKKIDLIISRKTRLISYLSLNFPIKWLLRILQSSKGQHGNAAGLILCLQCQHPARAPVSIQAAPFPASCLQRPEKAAEYSSSPWAPASTREIQKRLLSSWWLSSGQPMTLASLFPVLYITLSDKSFLQSHNNS